MTTMIKWSCRCDYLFEQINVMLCNVMSSSTDPNAWKKSRICTETRIPWIPNCMQFDDCMYQRMCSFISRRQNVIKTETSVQTDSILELERSKSPNAKRWCKEVQQDLGLIVDKNVETASTEDEVGTNEFERWLSGIYDRSIVELRPRKTELLITISSSDSSTSILFSINPIHTNTAVAIAAAAERAANVTVTQATQRAN